MTALATIRAILDQHADAGRTIDVWWRDDDAVRPTPALDRLLTLARQTGSEVVLAVVSATAERSLAERLDGERVAIAVHGYVHANHAPPGDKPAEFGPHRPMAAMAAEARRGRERLATLFPDADLAVFVPPWNRMAPALLPELKRVGFAAASLFGTARREPGRRRGPNSHLDPVDWRGTRSLAAPHRIVAAFEDAASTGEPVGLLTHHLCFDEALWRFCAELMALLAAHPAVRQVAARDLLQSSVSASNRLAARGLSTIVPDECRP